MAKEKLQDAFGQALLDFHRGKTKFCFVERDDNYLEEEDLSQYFKDYPDWLQMEREAVDEAEGRVLDIGCGAGRHSLYLQGKLSSVLGIDVSPLALEVCKLRGVRQTRLLGIDDVKKLPAVSVDTIIMMGNNFGLFGSYNRAKQLLKDFYEITSPNGKIIAEVCDPNKTDKKVHLDYHRLNLSRERMAGQLRLRTRYQNLVNPWFDYLFISEKELREIVEGTGWSVHRIIPSIEEPRLYGVVLMKS